MRAEEDDGVCGRGGGIAGDGRVSFAGFAAALRRLGVSASLEVRRREATRVRAQLRAAV